jgi:hypothetical protein
MRTHTVIGAFLGLAAIVGSAALAAPTVKAGHAGAARHAAWKHAHAAAQTVHSRSSHAASRHGISAAEAEKIARAKYHGKVIGHASTAEGGRDYSVRLLSGKTTRDVMVNRATGKIDSARIVTAKHDAMTWHDAGKGRNAAHRTARPNRSATRRS